MSESKETISQQVEERLQKQQSTKEFKDVGRVAQTKKEKSAYRLINSAVLKDLELDPVMAYNMVKKDTVWPAIDIQNEKGRGVSSGAVYLKIKIREAVPTRPKDEQIKRKSFVVFLEKLQADLQSCLNVDQIDDLCRSYSNYSMDSVIEMFIEPAFSSLSEEDKTNIKGRLKLDHTISFIYGGQYFFKKLVKEVFGAKLENMLFKYSDAAKVNWFEAREKESISEEKSKELIERLMTREKSFIKANEESIQKYTSMNHQQLISALSTDWRIADENKKIYKKEPEKFREFVIAYFQRKIEKEKLWNVKKFEDAKPREDDWSWTEESKKSTKKEDGEPKSEQINSKKPLSYIKRVGGYKIESITPTEIIDKFGFRAVNYGNYVNDSWSKEHTAHFLGAISDLAEMLDINIKEINNLGGLSIAFGAKGRAGHAATYFSQTKDINLTRGNGDGSVAHEWGHYFDNVIVELDAKKATNAFASSQNRIPNAPELNDLFDELMNFIHRGNPEYTPKLPVVFYARKQSENAVPTYFDSNNVAKTIEIKPTIEETLEQLDRFMRINQNIYSTQVRLFGYVIDAFGLEKYEVPMRLTTSYFYHTTAYKKFQYCKKSELNPNDVSINVTQRTKYWTSAVELFARCFETVVLKKLLDRGRVSSYLVSSIPMDNVVSEYWNAPYPSGKELDYLETIIDKIVVSVKQKFSISSFIAPSETKEDQYIEFEKKKERSGKTENAMNVETDNSGEKQVEFIEEGKVVETVEVPEESKETTEDKSEEIVQVIESVVSEPEQENVSEKTDSIEAVIPEKYVAWIEAIETWTELLEEKDSYPLESVEQWQDGIETYKELLSDAGIELVEGKGYQVVKSGLFSQGDIKSLEGLKKLDAKRFNQAIDFVYHDDKTNQFYFVDREGDIMEVKNENFLSELNKFYKTKPFSEGGSADDESEEVDLFEQYDLLPENIQALIGEYQSRIDDEDPYELASEYQARFEAEGYTFDWGLDGEATNLRKLKNGGSTDDESEEVDLFENYESLPEDVRAVLDKYSEEEGTYETLDKMADELEPLGYTFEYGLDAVPYDLKKVLKEGGNIRKFTEAEKWWGNDLSLNEQKKYAKKNLQGFEYDELMGSTAQYSNAKRRLQFINKIWEKEGSPKSVLKGLYSEGGAVSRIDKMVEHWNNEGWAGSHIENDDSEFFEKIGIDSGSVATTSMTGNDIKYYNEKVVEPTTGGFRKLKNGGSIDDDAESFLSWHSNTIDAKKKMVQLRKEGYKCELRTLGRGHHEVHKI